MNLPLCPGCEDQEVSNIGQICDSCLHSQPEDWVGHVIPKLGREAQQALGVVALPDGVLCPQQTRLPLSDVQREVSEIMAQFREVTSVRSDRPEGL